jgi:hypothetical protein
MALKDHSHDAPGVSAAGKTSSITLFCATHTTIPAWFCCCQCQEPLCTACGFEQSDHSFLCPKCMNRITLKRGSPSFWTQFRRWWKC